MGPRRRAGDTVETPHAFRGRVRAWLDANAPRKGEPGDFSAAHLVSAGTPEDYRWRERAALGVTMAWQRGLFDAGFAGRSWPREYGGAGAPAWQDEIVADEQSRYGVSTKMISVALEMVPPERLLFAPGLRLGGGTDEIQRNTIAERGLGLPRQATPAPSQAGETRQFGEKHDHRSRHPAQAR